jgi:hypothetical protein
MAVTMDYVEIAVQAGDRECPKIGVHLNAAQTNETTGKTRSRHGCVIRDRRR